MYATEASEAEMFAAGLRPEDFAQDSLEMWQENELPISVFSTISTQWRTGGMGGPCGLDYNVIFARMDRLGLSDEAHEQLFSDIRVIECEALGIINNRDKQ